MSGITVIASVTVRQGCPVRIHRHPRIKKGRRWRPPRDKNTSKSTLDVKAHRVTSPIHNPASLVQANIHHQLHNRSALASRVNNSKQARLPGYKRGHDTHRGHTFRSRAVRANRSLIETVGSGGSGAVVEKQQRQQKTEEEEGAMCDLTAAAKPTCSRSALGSLDCTALVDDDLHTRWASLHRPSKASTGVSVCICHSPTLCPNDISVSVF